jgi:chromosome segregation ATPase
LQEAWTALSSVKEVNVCHPCNGHTNDVTRCEEKNEDGIPAEVTELKQEICSIRKEHARDVALSKKIYDFHKLKKSLVHDSKLIAKIPDLEREIDTLKQENVKLSEDVNKKIVELREIEAAQSLLKEHMCTMENEKVKLSETLEGSFEEVRSLNSELSKLKKESDVLHNKNAIISRSLEEKYDELGKQSSENSRLKKENVSLSEGIANISKTLEDSIMEITELNLKHSRLEEEMCSMKNDNLNLSNILEEKILEIKQLSLKSNDANSAQLHENDVEYLKLKNDIPSLECEIMSLSSDSSDEKVVRIRALCSENELLKKEIDSYMDDITCLSACVKEKNIKIEELDSQNCKLKEELCFLKQTTLKMSENIEKKITEIRKAVNHNVIILKGIREKTAEMVMKVNQFNVEKSPLKGSIIILSYELRKKSVEVSELMSKLDEGDCLINLSKMLYHELQDGPLMIPYMKSEVFLGKNNISMKENANISAVIGQKHEELEKYKLKNKMLCSDRMSTSENPQQREKSQSACTAPDMKIAQQENRKLNCLRRKVAWQRRILNMTKERELKMKANIEICKETSLYFFI